MRAQGIVEATIGRLRPRRHALQAAHEPGDALFHGLRLSLTLWYSSVLAAVLLACGLVLYFWLQNQLLAPVENRLAILAEFQTRQWQRTEECGPPRVIPPPATPRPPAPPPSFVACFATDGELVGDPPPSSGTLVPEAFLTTSLVEKALEEGEGEATDSLYGGESVGQIYRRAVVLRDPESGEVEAVLQVGQSIAGQQDTLDLVRNLLLVVSVLAVGGSAAGGLLLANRALQPARIAFARQQEFIADASHELRTPLTLLRGEAELLLRHRDRLDAGDADLLDGIVTETAHMEELATNLLTLARLDSGTWQPEREVVELSDLANGVVRRVRTLAREKRVTLEEQYGPSSLLMGDRQALSQAALILLENAIKYTPAGGTVTVTTAAAGQHARLTVHDTGIGIPSDELKRLGERFYRLDQARVRETGGVGLGLAIAFRIAKAHGGGLHIDSSPAKGTRVQLTLPAGT